MKRYFLILLILLFCINLRAEELPQDAWLWNTISINKKLSKQWSVGIDEEIRMFDNMSRLNLFFTNAGVSYKVKAFKFSLVYRFINKSQDGQALSKRHRLYFDAAYKFKLKDFSFNYRARIQGQVRDYFSSKRGQNIESYLRHKLDISYDIGKYSPFVAAEFRFQLNNPSFHPADYLWDRMRFYAGVSYSINKRYDLQLYYMIQHDFNNLRSENDFTLGWQFSINL